MIYETKRYKALRQIPWRQKFDLLWWFGNDREPVPPPWYYEQQPHFTVLKWYLRNPLQNAGWFVFGVADRDREVYGPAPVDVTTWWEVGVRANRKPCAGFKWCITGIGWVSLPFISYESSWVIAYAGWQSSGFFGVKFNLKTSFQLW